MAACTNGHEYSLDILLKAWKPAPVHASALNSRTGRLRDSSPLGLARKRVATPAVVFHDLISLSINKGQLKIFCLAQLRIRMTLVRRKKTVQCGQPHALGGKIHANQV